MHDSSDDEAPDQVSSLATTFVASMVLVLIGFLAFIVLRPRFRHIYAPRSSERIMHYSYRNTRTPNRAKNAQKFLIPELRKSLLSWVGHTYFVTDEETMDKHGLDAVMFLRFQRMTLVMTVLFALYAFLVLLPLNYTASNKDLPHNDDFYCEGLAVLTMANIPRKSPRLWAHFISVFLFTGITFVMCYRNYLKYVELRGRLRRATDAHNFAIMITDIDANKSADDLRDLLELAMPQSVVAVHFYMKTPYINWLWDTQQANVKNLEAACTSFQKTGVRPQHDPNAIIPTGGLAKIARKTSEHIPLTFEDSINYFSRQVDQTDADLRNALDNNISYSRDGVMGTILGAVALKVKKEPPKQTRTAFVIFKTPQEATAAAQSLIHENPYKYRAHMAPLEEDILWENLGQRIWTRMTTTVPIWGGLLLLVIFWSALIIAVAALSTLSAWEHTPVLGWLLDLALENPLLAGLLEGIIPSLLVNILVALLPTIIKFLSRFQGFATASDFSNSVMIKYFIFLIVNVFLAYSAAGSAYFALDALKEITDRPRTVISILAASVPTQSVAMINYIIVQASGTYFSLLLQIPRFVLYYLKKMFLVSSERDLHLAAEPPELDLCVLYARQLLVFVLIIVYSTISPFVLPFGALYFLIGWITTKYLILNVFKPSFGNGNAWPVVFQLIMVGVMIYQLTIMGLFTMYEFPYQTSYILFVLLVLTCVFWGFVTVRFRRVGKYGALAALPRHHFDGDAATVYVQPALCVDAMDLLDLEEARARAAAANTGGGAA